MATATEEPPANPNPAPPKTSAFKDAFNKVYNADAPKPEDTPAPETKKYLAAPDPAPANAMQEAFLKTTAPKEEPKVDPAPPKNDKDENLANLRKAREEWERRATEAEKRAKDMEARIPTDYETLKAEKAKLSEEHALLSSELKKHSVQSTPEFKEKFDRPMDAAAQLIEKAVLIDGGKADKVLALLRQPETKERNDALSELMDELSPLSKNKVANGVTEFDRLREQREAELSNPDQTLKLSQEAQARTNAERQKAAAREIENVIEDTAKEFAWLKKGDNEALNTAIDELNQDARNIWNNPSSTKQQAQFAYRAAMTPRVFQWLADAVKQNGILQAELAKARGSSPKLDPNAPPGGDSKPKEGKGAFISSFKDTMAGKT